jgi:hypothetical protein
MRNSDGEFKEFGHPVLRSLLKTLSLFILTARGKTEPNRTNSRVVCAVGIAIEAPWLAT